MNKSLLIAALGVSALAVNATAQNTFPASGNVGIGTTNPYYGKLQIGDPSISAAPTLALMSSAADFTITPSITAGAGTTIGFGFTSGGNGPLIFSSTAGEVMRLVNGGSVGIGTTSPGANNKLEVNGNIALTASSGASITFQDGTTQSTAWTGTVCGGDYAESMDAAGGKAKYHPGDVLVLTADGNGDVQESSAPYSPMVAGIYATKPGVIGKRDALAHSKEDVPMAMIGVVPVKVSAENGAIHRGDLLVTASLTGYAMKGTNRRRMLGAVIGKAMGSLGSGTGVIEVLVTLQ